MRGPAAHHAADRAAACKTLSVCYLPSRAPRWCATAAARWGHRALPQRGTRGAHGEGAGLPCRAPRRWRGGAMGTSRPTATGPCNETALRGASGAHGNGAGCQAAHRADGAAARWGHRALPQRDRTTGPCNGARGKGAERGMERERGARQRRRNGAGVMAVGRDVPIAPHG